MTKQKIIAVRHLRAGGRVIPVHFSRNAGGSVAGRAVLGAQDTPILDGPDPEAVLAVLRDVIDGLLLARRPALASRGESASHKLYSLRAVVAKPPPLDATRPFAGGAPRRLPERRRRRAR